jgi:hypothetical protein
MARVQRAHPIAGQSSFAGWCAGPAPQAPFPSSQRFFQNGSGRSRARRCCAACEPLTDCFRSDTQSSEGKGAGSQGACPLAEYEAAPHGARQRAGSSPASFLANSLRIAFYSLTPAPLSPCFHPHSVCSLRRRCLLVFSIQGVLPSRCRSEGLQSPGFHRSAPNSQSPQLGAFAYLQNSNP